MSPIDLNKPVHIGTVELYFIGFTPDCHRKIKKMRTLFPKLKQMLKFSRKDGNRTVYTMANNKMDAPREVMDGCYRLFHGIAHIKSYDGCFMRIVPDLPGVTSVEIRDGAVGDAA